MASKERWYKAAFDKEAAQLLLDVNRDYGTNLHGGRMLFEVTGIVVVPIICARKSWHSRGVLCYLLCCRYVCLFVCLFVYEW